MRVFQQQMQIRHSIRLEDHAINDYAEPRYPAMWREGGKRNNPNLGLGCVQCTADFRGGAQAELHPDCHRPAAGRRPDRLVRPTRQDRESQSGGCSRTDGEGVVHPVTTQSARGARIHFNRLVADGFLLVERGDDDRRTRLVRLSPRGEQLLRKACTALLQPLERGGLMNGSEMRSVTARRGSHRPSAEA